jgi:glycosyltransferase 2 family protein
MNRKRLAIAVGLLVSLFFLWLALGKLKPEEFFASLQNVQPEWIILGAIVYFGAVLVISLRWQFLLRPIQAVPLFSLARIVCVGYMGNNVYPLRAGEALRIYLLKRNHGVPVPRSTTVVIVERVFDGLVMLAFIFAALLTVQTQSDVINNVATFAAPIFFIAMLIFFILAAQPDLLRRFVRLLTRLLPGRLHEIAEHLSEEVIHGLEALRSPLNLVGAVISSFLSWGIEALVYWIVMRAFNFDLPYAAALLVVGTVNLAGLLPAAPGNVGVYEFFVTAVLTTLGIAAESAAAYAIVVHIVIWLPVTLAGFVLLTRMGMSWTSVRKAKELETQAAVNG